MAELIRQRFSGGYVRSHDMNKLEIFSGNANKGLAEEICKELGKKLGGMMVERFSEGEIRVKIDDNVRGKDVFVIQPTCPPPN